MGESEKEFLAEPFLAEIGEEYNQRYTEEVPAHDRQRRLRRKQTVSARLQVLNLAGGGLQWRRKPGRW